MVHFIFLPSSPSFRVFSLNGTHYWYRTTANKIANQASHNKHEIHLNRRSISYLTLPSPQQVSNRQQNLIHRIYHIALVSGAGTDDSQGGE